MFEKRGHQAQMLIGQSGGNLSTETSNSARRWVETLYLHSRRDRDVHVS